MNTIKFRLAAKTDVGVIRTNNEDNFQVVTDLSSGQMRWVNNEICSLGDKGALLVVADGMGGMNAGEVASELAIETVREYFTIENLTPEITKNRFSIEKYMNDAIIAADARIKREAKEHPETKGMGTTIVIGWVLDGKLYLSWCGDSRAYIYNPVAGLHQVTKDHSYVQSLVDKGAITREDAFDYPDSNIITRSLSDGPTKARPESLLKPYDLCDNDIILLCTDGLSGMIRDKEMETIIRNNEHNMDTLVDDLIHAACEAEGSDNITICLCQILQGGAICNPDIFEESENRLNGKRNTATRPIINENEENQYQTRKKMFFISITCLVLVCIGFGVWYFTGDIKSSKNHLNNPSITDSMGIKEEKTDATTDKESHPTSSEDTIDTSETTQDKKNQKKIKEVLSSLNKEIPPTEEEKEKGEDVITRVGDLNETQTKAKEEQTPKKVEKNQIYKVVEKDTYYSLARKFHTSEEMLKKLNGNKALKTGEVILVPKKK